MAHEEYLRRNLLHASSVGVRANLRFALKRLGETKRPPKWLLILLEGTLERAEKVHPEMAAWRDQADDAPSRS